MHTSDVQCWSPPPHPALLALSQQPGHCLRPRSWPFLTELRPSVQEAPGPSRLWALVLPIEQLQKPRPGPRSPRCYLPVEAAGWGPTCHAPLVQGSELPAAGHSGPFGAPGLSVPHFLGEPGAASAPRPRRGAQAAPARPPPPGALALLLLTVGVGTRPRALLTPPRVGNRTFEVVGDVVEVVAYNYVVGIILLT